MKYITLLALLFSAACNTMPERVTLNAEAEPLAKLSEYGFFKNPLPQMLPNVGVQEYKLINTMFNDYAHKRSFVYVPASLKCGVDSLGNIKLPEGSCLINCVYYPNDETDSTRGNQLVETQLLIRTKKGWRAYNYVWNEDQSDASLQQIGSEKHVEFKRANGGLYKVDFMIASKNQCRSCHNQQAETVPIGFTNVRHLQQNTALNSLFADAVWSEKTIPHTNWQDKSASLENRVRGYLHINCAHCHSEGGPAKSSGLILTYDNYNMEAYGVCKSPPSSGKGNCNLTYDIVPGNPGQSIMVCRMASNDLEAKMPELGRITAHSEAVGLVVEWIQSLPPSACKTENSDR